MIAVDEYGILDLTGLHENQKKFIESEVLHTAIVGGYQSGKSVAAVIKMIVRLLQNPQIHCAYYLPTYSLITTMLIPKFEHMFDILGIGYVLNKSEHIFYTEYGKIIMRSMDKPDNIISYSVGYSIVDEADVVPEAKMKIAYGRIVARNSLKSNTPNSIDFVTTPEGFGFMYKMFVKKKNKRKVMYKLSTLDNEQNLANTYIDGLREAYTESQLKAYLDGEFVNLTSGTVYYQFNRKLNHTPRTIETGDVLHIGMDFNVTNMTALIHVIDDKPIAVAEITGAYDTPDLIRIINERYSDHSIVIYPDASGANRKTTGKSDIKLLKEENFKIRKSKKNPPVKDRVTDMNVAFCNSKGERSYYVNTDNCPNYTEALELQAYRNGEPDKTSGFDHINECGGYFIYQHKNKRQSNYEVGQTFGV